MIPSNRQPFTKVQAFAGIKQVDPSFDNILQEIHGCTDNPTGILKRMNGKMLNTTGVSGPVWSIGQFRFSDRIMNVRRTSSVLEAYADYHPIAPYIPFNPEEPTPEDPVDPVPNPGRGNAPWLPDYPEDGPKAPDPALIPQPTPAGPNWTIPLLPWECKVRCVPASGTIDLALGPETFSSVLDKYVDVGWGGTGDNYFKVELSESWLRMSLGGNGDIISTDWPDGDTFGLSPTFLQNFSVSTSSPPIGISVGVVSFTMMAYTGLGTYQPVVDSSGDKISANFTVTVKNSWADTFRAQLTIYVDGVFYAQGPNRLYSKESRPSADPPYQWRDNVGDIVYKQGGQWYAYGWDWYGNKTSTVTNPFLYGGGVSDVTNVGTPLNPSYAVTHYQYSV
jgi:hypothetical protein